jgi:leader peptidase (prepilin peptidase)/N-methyltransferase
MDPLPLLLTAVLFAVAGTVAGSFVALVSLRWPAGRPFLVARSACDACGAELGAAELVPLVSFAVQRGRCRRCGGRIARRHLAVEVAGAAIGAASVLVVPCPDAVAVAMLGWTLLLLALLDLEHFWLPSAVTWPLAAAGLAATAALHPEALADHAIGVVAGYASLALAAAGYKALRGRDGLGGGDAKLFAAAGAWLGWAALPLVLGSAAVAGLIVALLLWGRGVTAATRLPLGVFLAAAIWVVALAG